MTEVQLMIFNMERLEALRAELAERAASFWAGLTPDELLFLADVGIEQPEEVEQ